MVARLIGKIAAYVLLSFLVYAALEAPTWPQKSFIALVFIITVYKLRK